MQRLKRNSYYFYSKNRGFLITMGIIDYLQQYDFQRNVQGTA